MYLTKNLKWGKILVEDEVPDIIECIKIIMLNYNQTATH